MPFPQRQEFQNYERPAQLNGAPVQVKSEPGVKRDPYEEGTFVCCGLLLQHADGLTASIICFLIHPDELPH